MAPPADWNWSLVPPRALPYRERDLAEASRRLLPTRLKFPTSTHSRRLHISPALHGMSTRCAGFERSVTSTRPHQIALLLCRPEQQASSAHLHVSTTVSVPR